MVSKGWSGIRTCCWYQLGRGWVEEEIWSMVCPILQGRMSCEERVQGCLSDEGGSGCSFLVVVNDSDDMLGYVVD